MCTFYEYFHRLCTLLLYFGGHYEKFISSSPNSDQWADARIGFIGKFIFKYGPNRFRSCLFFIGIFLFLLIIGKLIFAFSSILTEMQNPIIASVSPTFTMGTLSISSGLHYYGVHEFVIHMIWILAATTQVFIIFYFVRTFIWKKRITISDIYQNLANHVCRDSCYAINGE